MIPTILILLGILFAFAVSEYKWKGALISTIIVGFLQDPIRKLSESDSSYFASLSLICFLLTFFILRSRNRLWNLNLICWSNPRVIGLVPVFVYLLFFQAFNSFSRFGDIRLSTVGLLFYLLPLAALWVGFHIGYERNLLRLFLITYLSICSIWAISILLSLSGVHSYLFDEVGQGIGITGIGSGESGLWRTSEIAGWHLAAGACFAFILGISETKNFQQYLYYFLSCGLSFLTITTGRRKALGLVLVFVSMYLLYFSFSSKGNRIFRALTSLGLVILLTLSSYSLFFNNQFQSNLIPYFERSSTLTAESSQERLSVQGIGALTRGLEIGGLLGFGVGSGSNSGNTGIGTSRSEVRSLSYVAEGGGGRIIVELGALGTLLFVYILINISVLYFRNYKIGKIYLPSSDFDVLVGLVVFVLTNFISFFTASQLYSDPFVLIVIGLCLGTFLAIPVLSSKYSIAHQFH